MVNNSALRTSASFQHQGILISVLLYLVLPAETLNFNAVALATLSYKEDGAPADWGVDALRAAKLAVASVNDPESGVLGKKGHSLNISSVVDTQCDANVTGKSLKTVLANSSAMDGVVAFLGPDCGQAAKTAAAATAADGRGFSVVSAGASASSLSDIVAYPTFVRVVPASKLFDTAVLYAAARYSWTTRAGNRAGVVFTAPDAMGQEAAAAMNETAYKLGINVVAGSTFPRNSSEDVVLAAVSSLQRAAVETVIIAAPVPETRSVFSAISKLRGDRNSWAPRMILSNEAIGAESQKDSAALSGAQGYITVLPGPYPLCSTTAMFAAKFPGANRWATFAYDSVLLLAHAVAAAAAEAEQQGVEAVTPASVSVQLRSVTVLDGVTGQLSIARGTNDRGGATRLAVMNLQGENVTAQHDFAVVGECVCDAAASPPVTSHMYHGEVRWPPVGQEQERGQAGQQEAAEHLLV